MNYEQKHPILQKLEEYFKNAPKEQIDKDWSNILKDTDSEAYYEKKYKEALGWMQSLYKGLHGATKEDAEHYFPELKESEDEKNIKDLIDELKCSLRAANCQNDACGGGHEKRIALLEWGIDWLEKQGNVDKASYEIAEKEKYDFVSGQFIQCRKSFNEFKEDNSYWFEYVGNDTYIGRSDNILNQKFHITPRQLYRLFTQQHCPKENDANEETNVPTGYGKYVDECLNEAAEHFFSEGEDKYSVADLFYAGVRCGKSWLEKQGEQPTDQSGYQAAIDAHPHWISVDDELPPRGRTDPYVSVPVITCKIVNRGLHEIGFQRYIFGNGKWEYCDATHWMPLPEPPKKGGEE